MNAFNTVNLAAACVLTSVEHAEKLGIPKEKWVYVLGGAGTEDDEHCEFLLPGYKCTFLTWIYSLETIELSLKSISGAVYRWGTFRFWAEERRCGLLRCLLVSYPDLDTRFFKAPS